jgi:AraC family transcriptional regulator, arabinose operon regulatory protein
MKKEPLYFTVLLILSIIISLFKVLTTTGFIFLAIRFQDFLTTIQFPLNEPIRIEKTDEIHHLIRQLEEESLKNDNFQDILLDLLLRKILLIISRSYHTYNSSKSDNPKLEESFRSARSTILSRLQYPWSIDEMAALTGLSTSRFSHFYQQLFQISPKKDLISERMNMACFLLESKSYSVSEVAQKVGYDNVYHFSKQFKLIYGKSPTNFVSYSFTDPIVNPETKYF